MATKQSDAVEFYLRLLGLHTLIDVHKYHVIKVTNGRLHEGKNAGIKSINYRSRVFSVTVAVAVNRGCISMYVT